MVNLSLSLRTFPAPLLWLGGLIAAGTLLLHDYLLFTSAPFLAGCAALFFCVDRSRRGTPHPGYLVAGGLFLLLWGLLPTKTLLYLALVPPLLFVINGWIGRTGFWAAACLFMASPVVQNLAEVFSFPIRLQLSRMAAFLLQGVAPGLEASGNMLIHQGQEFSVDPACMGLNMLVVSLQLGCLLGGWQEVRTGRTLGWKGGLLILLVLLLLNGAANLIRIFLLVWLVVLPDHPAHGMIGAVCLIIYVLLPAAWLLLRASRSFGRNLNSSRAGAGWNGKLHLYFLFFFLLLFLRSFSLEASRRSSSLSAALPRVPGYVSSTATTGVLQLHNREQLVYVKHLRGFYDAEHHPMLCWKGSGYNFEEVREVQVGGRSIYQARLVKGGEVLYTAWWYAAAERQTTSQFTWRWNNLAHGERYSLVNLTTATEERRAKALNRLLHPSTLSPLLK